MRAIALTAVVAGAGFAATLGSYVSRDQAAEYAVVTAPEHAVAAAASPHEIAPTELTSPGPSKCAYCLATLKFSRMYSPAARIGLRRGS